MITQINNLKAQRKAIVDQARELLDTAETEARDLNAEELETYEAMNTDIDALGLRIERMEQQLEREARYSAIDHEPTRPQPDSGDERESPRATKEYRSAFDRYIRSAHSGLFPEQVRALSVGSDPDGGYLVPDEMHNRIVTGLEEQNVMRQLATVIQTSSGSREIPVVTDFGTASWTSEGAAYGEDDPQFKQVMLGAHKLTHITKVSEELLNDSAFDIESFLAAAFQRAFGNAEETAFVNGNGIGKPTGFLADAEVGKTAASTTAITSDELIDTFHSLGVPYRARATWLMNDSTALAIRKLKDSDNQYLWQPGLQAGQPDVMLGRPVRISSDMPTIAASAKTVAFGDFSFYWIADRDEIGIQRLVELYAANGQVGFRMFMRVDGVLTLDEAVQVLQQAAS